MVVEGPIGVGKTSLSRRLAARYSAELKLEVVEENPFLAPFYENPASFAFQVQVYFLLSRYKQLSQLSQGGLWTGSVVGDYLFAKDFIFAAMNLKDNEFSLYNDLYSHLSPRLPTRRRNHSGELVVDAHADLHALAQPQRFARFAHGQQRPVGAGAWVVTGVGAQLLGCPTGLPKHVGRIHQQIAVERNQSLPLGGRGPGHVADRHAQR